jgi:mannitol/fructose-specific phosphotransferase system IIA component
MILEIDRNHILLGRTFSTRDEVVHAIGEVMAACGDATPRYVEGMLLREAKFSTWITEGVALPHGANEFKHEVLRSAIVLVQIPEGVDWGGGKIVHLAIGLAGGGEDRHVRMLTAIARVLQDRKRVDRLRVAADEEEVARILREDSP